MPDVGWQLAFALLKHVKVLIKCAKDRQRIVRAGVSSRQGTCQSPLTRIRRHWQQRDRSYAGGRLERANRVKPVGALARVEFAAGNSTAHRRPRNSDAPRAGEDRGQPHSPVAPAVEMGDYGPYFGRVGMSTPASSRASPARRQDRSYGSGDSGRRSGPPAPGPNLRGGTRILRTMAGERSCRNLSSNSRTKRTESAARLGATITGVMWRSRCYRAIGVCDSDCRHFDAGAASERRGV